MTSKEYAGQRLGLKCPYCQSHKLVKDGPKLSGGRLKQRFACHNCGRYTIHPKEIKK